ncbi:MAG: alpha/beta hydrolase [SAR202 cluster bacterium]|nr:alpha/beta hydrolase [SAR202 cluster bacterium]
MTTTFTQETISVGGAKLNLLKGGSGEPLLLLHGAGGNPGWIKYVQALADHYTVYFPSHPGFGASERPEWLHTMPDLACFYTWLLEEQGLEGIRTIGFSMGGWLAAEMAVACRHAFSKMMLVDAVGIKPEKGEIADIFIITPAQVTQLLFHDPQQAPEYQQLYGRTLTAEEQAVAERNREMAVRLGWKPYMHNPRLPGLLARVRAPTCIVWGRQDKLAPAECGELYHQAIPGSKLVFINNCGHAPQVEKPQEFVRVALDFLR